ncbi:DUF3179 domain-containing protein [Salinigranum salinum]|uniref:DUF3179 domain-containing protein n=1 Tax=Salinigranum salinum TaxID=1364937 RepID=UPI001260FCC3|nr:DUF3179 domain-containing protein [Salinigranum salinum]
MSPVPSRRTFLAASGVGLAGLAGMAGCLGQSGGDSGSGSVASGGGGTATVPDAADSGSTQSATDTASTDTSVLPTRDSPLPVEWPYSQLRDRTLSGGPPKDGIPSVDQPTFWSASEADDFLEPGDVVFGVAGEEDVKAYPQRILVWHEIANDTIDGENVTVSYCPLTGTALGFFRGETTFGVSGRLVNSNLVMYDRETDSRWPQVLATAMSGPFQGRSLTEFPITWTTWGRWKEAHPDTVVLSEDTGHVRNYNRDPYGQYNPRRGYYSNQNTLFSPLSRDDTYREKEVVIGTRPGEGAIAFHKESLREAGLLTGEVGGATFHAVYEPSLDTAHVYRGDGSDLSYADGQVSVGGETVAPDAVPLDPVLDIDAMWFAWAGFYPGTVVVE